MTRLAQFLGLNPHEAVLEAAATVGLAVVGRVTLLSRVLHPVKWQSGTTEERPAAIRRHLGRMAEYLDGLPASEPVVREPFERGLAAMRACQWEEAIGHFRAAKQVTPQGVHVVALLNLAGVCQYTRGRTDVALSYFEESARLAEQYEANQGKAQALNNIALIYRDSGQPEKALDYLEQSLAIARSLDNRWAVAIQLGNIGSVLHDEGDLNKALAFHEQALAISREIVDRWGEASELSNIGSIYQDKGDLDKALRYNQESLAISRRIAYRLGVVTGLANIAGIYRDKDMIEEAQACEEESLAIARSAGYSLGIAVDLGNIGFTLMSLNKHKQAVPKLAEALTILLAIGVADGPRQALTGLVRCDDRLGRKRVEDLLKEAGLDDETIAELLARIDQTRMKRPEQSSPRLTLSPAAG